MLTCVTMCIHYAVDVTICLYNAMDVTICVHNVVDLCDNKCIWCYGYIYVTMKVQSVVDTYM